MTNRQSLQPWVAIGISVASLTVSIYVAVNSSIQTKTAEGSLATANEQLATARSSYETALQQLAIAKDAQLTSEKNYKIAEQNFEFQKSLIEQDNGFAYVFDQTFLDAIDSPIGHQAALNFSIFNKTKRTQSYRVEVESEGFTVYWNNRVPQRPQFSIYLDRNSTAVSPETPYTGLFVIWHHAAPSPVARLLIKVNSAVVLDRRYAYNPEHKTYVQQGN